MRKNRFSHINNKLSCQFQPSFSFAADSAALSFRPVTCGFSIGMVFNEIKNIFCSSEMVLFEIFVKKLIKLQTRNKHHPLIWYNNINPFHMQHMLLTKKPQNQALFLDDWTASVSLTFYVLTYFQKIILCALLRFKIWEFFKSIYSRDQ